MAPQLNHVLRNTAGENAAMQGRKKRTGFVLALTLAVTAAGCDSFLDVNENPNAPEVAPADVTLGAVIANFGNGVLGGWPAKMSAEWTQQVSFNRDDRGWARYDQYEMRPEDASLLWDIVYTRVLNESRNIIESSEERGDWAYAAPAKVIHAWTLAVATDVWGPIPMTEALDPEKRKPAYDDQKTVYTRVLSLLDEAIADEQKPVFPTRVPEANDLLFSGERYKWVLLANVLKAETHLKLAYAPGENMQTHAQAALTALQGGFESNRDDADFRYATSTAGRAMHPWNIARTTVPGYRVSQFYVTLLQQRSDPRLNITADVASGGVRRGHRNGDPQGPDAMYSAIGSFFAGDTLFNWKSFAEAKFIEAEARLIANGAADADAAYRAGIRANMEKLRVSAANTNTYVNARPNLSTVANPLEEIMREKFIANFLKHEAWSDWRRTGFPRLTPVPNALLPGIPERFPWPSTELSENTASVQATGIPSGLAGMSTPVWWASR
jgi:hypothetical protein